MVNYTPIPLITHSAVLHGASQNWRCGPSSSPPSNSSSPRLELNLSPSSIMNLSNNSITLQTIDSPHSPSMHQPQNYSNDQIVNHKLVDLTYVNLQQQQHVQQHPTILGTKNAGKFKCEQCNMSFGSKSAHTSHIKSHVKQLPGNQGGIDLTNSRTVNPANGSDQYQCDVCQKTFAVPARLIRHYRTHTGERPFECKYLLIFLL